MTEVTAKTPREYVAVLEAANDEAGQFANYSAFVAGLPGCITVGDTVDDIEANLREAIELHLEGLAAEGRPVPAPSARTTVVRVSG